MRRGDFETAWAVNDWVLAHRNPAERDDPAKPYHLRWVWDGRPFVGRDVLVRCYHGLGDTIQFCRYLAPLRRRVRSLTLEVQPALLPLLAALAGPDRLLAFQPHAPAPASECDLEIMELAHALRMRPEPAPYLRLPAPAWPARDGTFAIGLCWQVNTGWAPDRSVPLAALAPLGTVPGVTLFSLQRGPGAADLRLPDALRVANPDEVETDILATARLILSLDLVVTIDTMVAHLAGALGVPVWLLLTHDPDWRWLAGGSGSPWYANVRKYRQNRPGDWSRPAAELAADLTEMAEGHSVTGT
ncbi:MAG: hypothetical protein JOZ05_08995 [Acetobacteraceae bacterium]|nr:hypothetical protein [Acetobacteraceae bacterium]